MVDGGDQGRAPGGAPNEFRFGPGAALSFRVDRLEPGRHVAWTGVQVPADWRGTRIDFAITPRGDSVDLRFSHAGFAHGYERLGYFNYRSAQPLRSLTLLLECGRGEPFGSAASTATGDDAASRRNGRVEVSAIVAGIGSDLKDSADPLTLMVRFQVRDADETRSRVREGPPGHPRGGGRRGLRPEPGQPGRDPLRGVRAMEEPGRSGSPPADAVLTTRRSELGELVAGAPRCTCCRRPGSRDDGLR